MLIRYNMESLARLLEGNNVDDDCDGWAVEEGMDTVVLEGAVAVVVVVVVATVFVLGGWS